MWVPTVFTKNRDRLLTTDTSRKIMAAIMAHREVAPLPSRLCQISAMRAEELGTLRLGKDRRRHGTHTMYRGIERVRARFTLTMAA